MRMYLNDAMMIVARMKDEAQGEMPIRVIDSPRLFQVANLGASYVIVLNPLRSVRDEKSGVLGLAGIARSGSKPAMAPRNPCVDLSYCPVYRIVVWGR